MHKRTKVATMIALATVTLALAAPQAGAQTGTFKVSSTSGPRGMRITVSSVSPCSLPSGVSGSPFVRVAISQGSTVIARQDFQPSSSGAWSGSLTVGANATPGAATIGGDCVASAQAEGLLLHYQDVTFTVTASSPTTTSTSVTTTTAPSSGASSSHTWLVVLMVVVVVLLLLGVGVYWRRRSKSSIQ